MIDLLIMSYPHVEWHDDEFAVATVFGDVPLICFNAVPIDAFEHIEKEIENIIEHETIGIILEKICKTYHEKYDSLFPYTHSLRDFKDSNMVKVNIVDAVTPRRTLKKADLPHQLKLFPLFTFINVLQNPMSTEEVGE